MPKKLSFLPAKLAITVVVASFVLVAQATAPGLSNELKEMLLGKQEITLFVAGDIMFDRGIRYYAEHYGGYDHIFSQVSDFLKNHNLVVANLEGPITDNPSKSAGTAIGSANNYYFTFDPSVADVLFAHNIRLVSLGNNHILNFGAKGVAVTQEYLSKAHVDYFGAPESNASIIKDVEGLKVALVNYNQFYGTAEYAEKTTVHEIEKVRKKADIVLVFCHWGEEYNPDYTAGQQRLARTFIDHGADVVIGAHPHVIEPMEEYKGKRIYYSLGNFVFDQYFQESVRNGMGVSITIDKKTKKLSFEERYFYLDRNGQTTHRN